MARPRIAIYKLSSCAGCQLQILNLEPVLFDLVGAVDIAHFIMAGKSGDPPYDIGFVEGAVTCQAEVDRVNKARGECGTLVALGACACSGGIPALKNAAQGAVARLADGTPSLPARAIDHYVPVDWYLRGCPIDRNEFVEFVTAALLGTTPHNRSHSVCAECWMNESECLYLEHGQPCLGPVTAAGCGALCPGHGRGCSGCRGPAADANPRSLTAEFRGRGISQADIARILERYGGFEPEPEVKAG